MKQKIEIIKNNILDIVTEEYTRTEYKQDSMLLINNYLESKWFKYYDYIYDKLDEDIKNEVEELHKSNIKKEEKCLKYIVRFIDGSEKTYLSESADIFFI